MSTASFKFQNAEFPIVIKVGRAISLKHEFGINLLNLFEGANLEEFAQTMSLNDEKIIDLMWYFVQDKFSDREAWIESLERDDLTRFKEAFWAGVINFSDPAAKPLIAELQKRLPELLKQNVLQNLLPQADQSQLKQTS